MGYKLQKTIEFQQALGVGEERKPGILQFTGSQRVRHDSTTELN